MSWKESARGGLLSSLKHSQQTQCVLGMSDRERQRVSRSVHTKVDRYENLSELLF